MLNFSYDFFELSGILKILKTLEIYRGAVAVEFYRIFCICKHKFYRTAGLGLRCMLDKFYFCKNSELAV